MEGRSPTGYRVPAFFSHILHVLPQCIPAFSAPTFYTFQSRTPAFYQHPIILYEMISIISGSFVLRLELLLFGIVCLVLLLMLTLLIYLNRDLIDFGSIKMLDMVTRQNCLE